MKKFPKVFSLAHDIKGKGKGEKMYQTLRKEERI
jgi:hypothetical protein